MSSETESRSLPFIRWFFPLFWLVFLSYPLSGAWSQEPTARFWGLGLTVVFAIVFYLALAISGAGVGGLSRQTSNPDSGLSRTSKWVVFTALIVMIVLAGVAVPLIGETSLSFLAYISVIVVAAVLHAQHPQVKVIIVTTYGRPGWVKRAIDAEVSGFMVKDAPVEHLAEGIRRVMAGLSVIDPELVVESSMHGINPLTERETDVLRATAGGGSIEEVASAPFLSTGTVRNRLSAAIGKTDARNRADAARIARDNGWL